MATIHNSEITKTLRELADIQLNEVSNLPLGTTIAPVLVVNPHNTLNYFANSQKTTTGDITITIPSNKDFYLTGLNVSFIKDATCDISTGRITVNATPKNDASKELMGLSVLTTTAQNQSLVQNFQKPILLERGSSIIMGGTYSAGLMSRYISLNGYTVEVH